jgi:hypothetical protein
LSIDSLGKLRGSRCKGAAMAVISRQRRGDANMTATRVFELIKSVKEAEHAFMACDLINKPENLEKANELLMARDRAVKATRRSAADSRWHARLC